MARPNKRNFEIPLSIRVSPKLDGELTQEAEAVNMQKSAYVRLILRVRKKTIIGKLLQSIKE